MLNVISFLGVEWQCADFSAQGAVSGPARQQLKDPDLRHHKPYIAQPPQRHLILLH